MTQKEIAARKAVIVTILVIGGAALMGSSTISYVMPRASGFAIILTAIFFACVFSAGIMAIRLNKETAAK